MSWGARGEVTSRGQKQGRACEDAENKPSPSSCCPGSRISWRLPRQGLVNASAIITVFCGTVESSPGRQGYRGRAPGLLLLSELCVRSTFGGATSEREEMVTFHATGEGDRRCTPPVSEAQSEWASL